MLWAPRHLRKFLGPELVHSVPAKLNDTIVRPELWFVRLIEDLLLDALWDNTHHHVANNLRAVFEFASIGGEDIKPVIEMFLEFTNVVAPGELLEPPEASKLNGIVASLILKKHATP